jgi:hypothetical protein
MHFLPEQVGFGDEMKLKRWCGVWGVFGLGRSWVLGFGVLGVVVCLRLLPSLQPLSRERERDY